MGSKSQPRWLPLSLGLGSAVALVLYTWKVPSSVLGISSGKDLGDPHPWDQGYCSSFQSRAGDQVTSEAPASHVTRLG